MLRKCAPEIDYHSIARRNELAMTTDDNLGGNTGELGVINTQE